MDRIFNITDSKGRPVATLRTLNGFSSLNMVDDGNVKAFEGLKEVLNKQLKHVNREQDKARRDRKSISLSCITQSDVHYPKDVFNDIISGNDSPYAFYLFGWVDYHGEDCAQWRLKLMHDVELHDGTILEYMYPNATAWSGSGGRVEDKDVNRIRLSKCQSFGSRKLDWTKPISQSMGLI